MYVQYHPLTRSFSQGSRNASSNSGERERALSPSNSRTLSPSNSSKSQNGPLPDVEAEQQQQLTSKDLRVGEWGTVCWQLVCVGVFWSVRCACVRVYMCMFCVWFGGGRCSSATSPSLGYISIPSNCTHVGVTHIDMPRRIWAVYVACWHDHPNKSGIAHWAVSQGYPDKRVCVES